MARARTKHRVVIVGGGFGGVRAALDLVKMGGDNVSVTLISDRPHFEYYPTLYRVVTGYSPAQVAIPYSEIFRNKPVDIINDKVVKIDLAGKLVYGGLGSPYEYDSLVMALGSETGYFNIPGLPELSYGFKSVSEAERLKAHLASVLTPVVDAAPEQKVAAAHFIIVGGGPTGVELAGELASYARHLAKKKGFDPSFITVSLIEAMPRLLIMMPEDISRRVETYLHGIGVNIYVNRTVTKQEVEELFLKDMSFKTKTVVWTAGVKPNALYAKVEGFEYDKRGRVMVDDYLRAKGHTNVYVIGDAASTANSGMAQTASKDGTYIAKYITKKVLGKTRVPKYVSQKPIYAIPAGRHWAAVLWGDVRVFGLLAYCMRKAADYRFFLTILPFWKATKVFRRVFVRSDLP
ncbi:MAG TPA: NAD(P)/FAD-dependent oxidoreductase [Verrucomicrobiae bacterium]|nr:NAD(P)/FAD-dependent oxidoreductase [Verrucomicrobiae bacterium]